MGYVFLGCLSRLGSMKVTGPVTGQSWTIRSSGDWVLEEDASVLLNKEVEICCVKTLGKVRVKPLHHLVPTIDDLNRKPKEEV